MSSNVLLMAMCALKGLQLPEKQPTLELTMSALAASMAALEERTPKTFQEAMASPDAAAWRAALDAEITVSVNPATAAKWQPLAEELRFLFISGDVTVSPVQADEVFVLAQPSTKTKCVRCWHHRADVGVVAEHPELCGRCVSNIEGPGEDRKWF